MFWKLFAKKKKASVPVVQSPSAPKDAVFSGTLPPGEAYYTAAQNAVEALQNIGFAELVINTSGENSGHMWTRAYQATYTDLQKFLLCGRDDYQKECDAAAKGGGPTPDWDTTRFILRKKLDDHVIHIRIVLPENDTPGHIASPPEARWVLACPAELAQHPAVTETMQLLKDHIKT